MKFVVSAAIAERGEVRLRFRRIPVQSCVVSVHADDASAPLASAPVYGRGEGSNATERVVLPLRFAPGSIHEGQTLVVRATSLAGEALSPADLELIDASA